MEKIGHWLKRRGTAGAVLAASIMTALFLLFVLGAAGGFADGSSASAWIAYYSHTFSGSFSGFFSVTVTFLCVAVIMLVMWSFGKEFLGIIFPRLRGAKGGDLRDTLIASAKRSREAVWIIFAVMLVLAVALIMGEANIFAPARLQDQMIIGGEQWLFGNYAFAALGAVHYPHWLITFIIFSFVNMDLILITAGIILSYIALERFRELLVAFSVGMLFMVPLWLAVPALSPQDRYINNIYHLPDPPQLALAVQNYHPQPELADFLQSVRVGKASLPSLPTSTIPSAHVFWAALAGYYLFRAKRWLGWVALPFLSASTFGTVLLAQHYFMDIPAGLAVAALAIWLAGSELSFLATGSQTG